MEYLSESGPVSVEFGGGYFFGDVGYDFVFPSESVFFDENFAAVRVAVFEGGDVSPCPQVIPSFWNVLFPFVFDEFVDVRH